MLLFDQVQKLPFRDHNAPPLNVLVEFCRQATAWLNENPGNVVAVCSQLALHARQLLFARTRCIYITRYVICSEILICAPKTGALSRGEGTFWHLLLVTASLDRISYLCFRRYAGICEAPG